jgi:hypothetical protein
MQNVVAILPDGFDHHQRSLARDFPEDLHAALLAVNETVLFGGVEGMAAAHLAAGGADRGHDGLLGAILGGPASLVGGETQVAIGDKDDGLLHAQHFGSRDGERANVQPAPAAGPGGGFSAVPAITIS